MLKEIKNMYQIGSEIYHEDRREFWDAVLGGLVILGMFLFIMFIVIPIFG